MTIEERVERIITRIEEMKDADADMTEALSIMGINVNGEEEE